MKKIKKHLKLITIIVVMIIIIGGLLIKYSLNNNEFSEISIEELELEEVKEESNEKAETEVEKIEEIKKIYVDVKGAVKKPGVYEIEEDKKVIDVLDLAGGLTENADTSMINLAKKIYNEMVIIIYTADEVEKAGQNETVVKVIEKECVCPEIKNDACLNQDNPETNIEQDKNNQIDNKININTATLEELLTISGIGESKAKAIIEYRKEFGNFEKIEDIMQVSGIGETLYEKIKNNITI